MSLKNIKRSRLKLAVEKRRVAFKRDSNLYKIMSFPSYSVFLNNFFPLILS